MKKNLKISLSMIIIVFAFILFGSTNVNAAGVLKFDVVEIINIDSSEATFNVLQEDVTTYDFGNITFGEERELALLITNTTGVDITTFGYDFYLDDTSTDSSNIANRYGDFHLYWPLTDQTAAQRITFSQPAVYRIKIDEAEVATFGIRDLNVSLIFETINGNISFDIKGKDSSLVIDEPVTNPNSPLVYNGSEQTMQFYYLNSGIYDDTLFTGVTPALQVSENTGTDAGIYTARIKAEYNALSWNPSLTLVGNYNNTILVQWEIKKKVETLAGTVYNGLANNQLSTVDLPTGWDWVNPTTSIKSGTNKYEAIYTPTDTKNYETVREDISVNGTPQFSIKFNLTKYGETDASSNNIYLETGQSKTYQITTLAGYQFTSIKINGIEQLLNGQKTISMPININNIDENYEIVATTERITTIPEQGYDNLTIDVKNNNILEIKFPGDFATFKPKEVRINDKVITTGFSFKEGSIIMVLEESLLSTLVNGNHNIEITLEDNSIAVASFNVTGSDVVEPQSSINPLTGDNILIYSIIAIISLLGVAITIILKKRNKINI